jgi:photosystem II PsbH protein
MTPSLAAFLSSILGALFIVIIPIYQALNFVSGVDRTIRYLAPTGFSKERSTILSKIPRSSSLLLGRRNGGNRMLRTSLGAQLAPLNSEVGLVAEGWGTTPLMAVVMALLLVFIVIIVQLFNGSIILENFDLDWSAGNVYNEEYLVL